MFKIKCIGATYKNHRFNNEDNYYIKGRLRGKFAKENHNDKKFSGRFNDKKRRVFGVFDGLGGEDRGEVASFYAAKILHKFDLSKKIEKYYNNANEVICGLRNKNSSKVIGTTAVLMDIKKGRFVCSNIGDSRAYIIRNDEITQLSYDHTSMQMLIDTGVMTKEELINSKYKNTLSQCLGTSEDEVIISPYIAKSEHLKDGDIFLLCSDGLTGSLSDEEIKDIILSEPKRKVRKTLYKLAEENGAKDNITMIILYVKEQRGFFK